MITFARAALASLAVLVATGCGGTPPPPAVDETQATEPAGLSFVPAPPDLRAKCRATATTVGYPVPCPTRVPPGLVASPGKPWEGWVIGSSEPRDQHLVITASPRPLANYAKVVNGPAWYPAARVRLLAWLTINGWRMRAVYAPQDTNDGSAFAHHVVLVWTVGQHTYGIGFHNHQGIPETLRLNEALARSIVLVGP